VLAELKSEDGKMSGTEISIPSDDQFGRLIKVLYLIQVLKPDDVAYIIGDDSGSSGDNRNVVNGSSNSKGDKKNRDSTTVKRLRESLEIPKWEDWERMPPSARVLASCHELLRGYDRASGDEVTLRERTAMMLLFTSLKDMGYSPWLIIDSCTRALRP
jgi:hypothetical protein